MQHCALKINADRAWAADVGVYAVSDHFTLLIEREMEGVQAEETPEDAPVGGVLQRYRGISIIRKRTPLGPCRRPVPWVLGGS